MKIDQVDAKIIKALLLNPRTSFSEIAKDCKMSTNAIRMRFKTLKKKGVITGSIIQINPKSLGYNCNGHLLIQTSSSEDDMVDFLSRIPNILGFHKQVGRLNFVAFFALKNFSDLDGLVQQINSNPKVQKTEVDVWWDVINLDHPENLTIIFNERDQKKKKSDLYSKQVYTPSLKERIEGSSVQLDGFDYSIMKLLSDNARLSFNKIGDKIGLSTQRVIERFHKMEQEKIISFSSITVDLKKIGYNGMVFFRIMVSNQSRILTVFERILKAQNVIVAYRTLGNFQILVGIPYKNIEMLEKTYNEIIKILGVTGIEISLHKPFPSWPLNLFSKIIPTKR